MGTYAQHFCLRQLLRAAAEAKPLNFKEKNRGGRTTQQPTSANAFNKAEMAVCLVCGAMCRKESTQASTDACDIPSWARPSSGEHYLIRKRPGA